MNCPAKINSPAAMEINEVDDLLVAGSLVSLYFKKGLHV
jgi:hypothetical protein